MAAKACRICLEDGSAESGRLVAPCACRGSSAWVHEECLSKWCERKDDFYSCDLCHQAFTGPTAVVLSRAALERVQALAETDPKRTRALHLLATALDKAGQHGEAASHHRNNFQALERRLGQDHPDTLAVMSSLAHALNLCGGAHRKEALELHQRCYAAYRRRKGEEHASTLTAANNLALALCDDGRCQEGAKLLELVLAGRQRVLGNSSPETVLAANNLAGALVRCGLDATAAREHLQQAVTLLQRVLGEEHEATRVVTRNLEIAKQSREPNASKAVSATGADCGAASPRRKRPRPPQEHEDMVLALLLQAGLELDRASSLVPKFVDEGFDSAAALATVQEADLVRLGVTIDDRQRVLQAYRKGRH
mmetsp:Transcript_40256/g.92561  ORF Transcript_40256/g.92561 Transcript_40256/m.92561 type:complete len:367 (+) Transcript_40256:24-1124(+)